MFEPAKVIGPSEGVFLVGPAVLQHPSGDVVAEYSEGLWKVGDSYYPRADYEGSVLLSLKFIRADQPLAHLVAPVKTGFLADGHLYAEGKPVARLLESGHWLCASNRFECPVIFAEPQGNFPEEEH